LPRSRRLSLMCSYWRSRLALHRACGIAYSPEPVTLLDWQFECRQGGARPD
jgi:hypothetical protein